MLSLDRMQQIVAFVDQKEFVTIKELADKVGISQATIRRDIAKLDEDGQVKKVQGGVVSVRRNRSQEPALRTKKVSNTEEKERIAEAALRYIKNGEHVIFDSGTTLLTLAKKLKELNDLADLTVITYDMLIAFELAQRSNIDLLLAGGILRKNFYSFYGYFTENMFSEMHVNKAFFSCDALDLAQGIMSYSIDDISVKRSIIDSADEIILLCDHSKLDIKIFINICALNAIDRIIIGHEADPATLAKLRESGIEVEVV